MDDEVIEGRAALALVVALIRTLKKKGLMSDDEVSGLLAGAIESIPGQTYEDRRVRDTILLPGQYLG